MFCVEGKKFVAFSAALNWGIKLVMRGSLEEAKVRNHVGTLLVDCVRSDDGRGNATASLHATDVGKKYMEEMI